MQYDSEEFNELLNIFKVESEEIIQELNDGFLALEQNPENKQPLKRLFQLSHSLKGAARMISFNSIQDIAHKLEDVFSYWKKDEVKIEKTSFQLMYDVCDFLSELITKSVEQKSDYTDTRVMSFIGQLENFITYEKMIPVQQVYNNSDRIILDNTTNINATILELMFILEKEDDVDENLTVLEDNLNRLLEIIQSTQYLHLKNHIKNIVLIINREDISKQEKIGYAKDEILKIRTEIYNIYRDLNIASIENNSKKVSDNEIKKVSDYEPQVNDRFDLLLKNLHKIKFDKEYIDEVISQLEDFVAKAGNNQIENILKNTIDVLNLFKRKNLTINNDYYMVILQCINCVKNITLGEKNANINNINFLMQRLSVVEDMVNVSDLKGVRITDETNLLVTNAAAEIENDIENIKKIFSTFEFNSIKTLRVDTAKLDNLIAKVSEHIVNGIKNREHFIDSSNVSTKLNDWYNLSRSFITYIKYFEKKGLLNTSSDDVSLVYYKKMRNYFFDNINKMVEIQNDLTKVFNTLSEDHIRLHQTALEIASIAKEIRVLPLATIFHSFPRMVRDIAIEYHKKVDFIVLGSDTTIDKKLIEEIKMPLIHILRNAVSHGIEVPQERLINGKCETGVIKLAAKQVDNNVIISIEDDGYGINLEKVKQSTIKKGILTKEEVDNLNNEQLMKLLFVPGFSTEESINELSGRGIGLDVVKTKIKDLDGDIFIDSVLNQGCRVTIKLPITLSTLQTFVISLNGQKYAVPVSYIKLVKKIYKNEIFDKNGQNNIVYDNRSCPVYFLSEIMGESPESAKSDNWFTVIIVENHDTLAAFVVDKFIGAQEVVYKKLIPPIIRLRNILGFTTIATGEICFILSPSELIRNTVIGKFKPEYQVLSMLDKCDKIKSQKVLLLDDDSFMLKNDLSQVFGNLVVFNNVYSLYDYMRKNPTDFFICKYKEYNEDVIKLVNYMKTDEILNDIKIAIISDVSDVKHLKADLLIQGSKYEKDTFIDELANLL